MKLKFLISFFSFLMFLKGITQTCNSWLKTPTSNSYFEIGDVDVTGNQMTIECNFNANLPNTSILNLGELVCKNTNGNDANYALWPEGGVVTTTNGIEVVGENCSILRNKTYHNALVYDGQFLYFYRNGVLHSKKALTGNLITNNLITTIASNPIKHDLTFNGNINEVRIWKVARTQQQIQQFMNDTLPNPSTQSGLIAYYTFNSLINKVGSGNFNGTLVGSATINETNPQCNFIADSCGFKLQPIAGFTIPDTVCVNETFNVNNITTNATSYNWSFCEPLNNAITGNNIGNINNSFKTPVNIEYVVENGNHFAFVLNFNPSSLIRLDFGNSFLNTPIAIPLTNLNGLLWNGNVGALALKIIKQNGNWIAIVAGGSSQGGNPSPRIYKLDFGSTITNLNPSLTNWGRVGSIDQPHQIHLWEENNNWYGLVCNSESNTISRINFGSNFSNTPTESNLGNLGNFNFPSHFSVIKTNSNFYVFVTNTFGNTITRLDFGTSLLNTPTGVNFGNISGLLNGPRGIKIYINCNKIYGNLTNQFDNNTLSLEFGNSITFFPTATSLGNIGIQNNSSSISKDFIENGESYFFRTNSVNNTISLIKFPGCTNSSIPNSSSQTPPQISYNSAGTYNVNLTIDEGLPSQESICKQIVVKNCDTPKCKGAIELHTFDGATLPAPQTKYYTATGFTWETWFKLNSFDNTDNSIGTNQLLISAIDPTLCEDIAVGFGWDVAVQKNELGFIADGNGQCASRDNNPCKYKPTTGFKTNTWYHVAAVKDYTSNKTKLYLNGILVDSKTNNSTSIARNMDAQIGRYVWSGGTVKSIDGEMDEIRFWNYPRTDNEIKNSFNNCLIGNENGLVVYYKCNERNGLILKDYSLNKFNAALDNSIVWKPYDNSPINTNCENPTSFTKDTTICKESIFWGYNITGKFIDTFINAKGCDSIRILNLNVDSNLSCNLNENPRCLGVVSLSNLTRIIPPQTNFKQYFPPTGFTWECWFNSSFYNNNSTTLNTRNKIMSATDEPNCQDIVLGFGWPNVAQQKELCFLVDGSNTCTDRDNNPCKYFPTGGFIPNTWYHVAAVKDYTNNTTQLFVNGILVDSKINNKQPITPNKNLLFPNFQIGSWSGIFDSAFAGKLDEIRIWDYPRTATEIQNNYNKCLSSNENGLVAYYHCNDSSNSKLIDVSKNTNHATINSNNSFNKKDNAPLVQFCSESTYKTIDTTICFGQNFLGKNTSGKYVLPPITNFYGCDSIVTLNLKVLDSTLVFKDTTLSCKPEIFNGVTFSKDTLVKLSSLPFKNYNCDSFIYYKQILIQPIKTTLTSIFICRGTNFWGYSTPGTYDSTFKTSNGCDSIVEFTINLINAIRDTVNKTICFGESYRNATTNTSFIDTIKTPNTCDTIRLTKLFVRQKIKKQLPIRGSICLNEFYKLDAGNFKKYLWNTGDTTRIINATLKGWYKVLVTDTNNCKQLDSFNLFTVDTPKTDFIPNNPLSFCLGEKYSLFGFLRYKWNTGEETNSIMLNGLPMYIVTVTDINNCNSKDTLRVNYSNKLEYNLPTAFSPNGDRINDEFQPFKNSNCLTEYRMQIFNKWGQKVFGTKTVNEAWTGKYNSVDAPTDVYYYLIYYKTISGLEETKSGFITLFR